MKRISKFGKRKCVYHFDHMQRNVSQTTLKSGNCDAVSTNDMPFQSWCGSQDNLWRMANCQSCWRHSKLLWDPIACTKTDKISETDFGIYCVASILHVNCFGPSCCWGWFVGDRLHVMHGKSKLHSKFVDSVFPPPAITVELQKNMPESRKNQ